MTTSDPATRMLLWRVGAARCGATIDRVLVVLTRPPVTAIPGSPDAVCGIANVRGRVVTVFDGRTLLGEADTDPGRELVLVQLDGGVVALEVDEVEDLVAVPESALIPEAGGRWLARVPGGPDVRVLDLRAMLDPLLQD